MVYANLFYNAVYSVNLILNSASKSSDFSTREFQPRN